MKNKQITKKIVKSQTIRVENIFHIATQFNSGSLFSLLCHMDKYDFMELLPKVKKEKIEKAISEAKQVSLLYDNLTGYLAEVYFQKIICLNKKELILDAITFHTNLVYADDFDSLIDKIILLSEEYKNNDLKKIHEKKSKLQI